MKTRFATWCILLLTISTVSMAAPTLAEIEGAVMPKLEGLDGYKADIEMIMQPQGAPAAMKMEGRGTMESLFTTEPALFRMDVTNTMEMGENTLTQQMSTVFDGKSIFTEMEMMGSKQVMKMPPEIGMASGMYTSPGKSMFENLRENFDVTVENNEAVDGDMCYVLRARLKEDAVEEIAGAAQEQVRGTVTMHISQESGLQRKLAMADANGNTVMTITYKNIQKNPSLSADRFVYTPPAGVNVLDMTDVLKKNEKSSETSPAPEGAESDTTVQ